MRRKRLGRCDRLSSGRLAIYTLASSMDAGHDAVCSLLDDFYGESRAQFEPYPYIHADREAVGHLFSVAAGLNSMVLGKPQVLAQVTGAMESAPAHGAVRKLLADWADIGTPRWLQTC